MYYQNRNGKFQPNRLSSGLRYYNNNHNNKIQRLEQLDWENRLNGGISLSQSGSGSGLRHGYLPPMGNSKTKHTYAMPDNSPLSATGTGPSGYDLTGRGLRNRLYNSGSVNRGGGGLRYQQQQQPRVSSNIVSPSSGYGGGEPPCCPLVVDPLALLALLASIAAGTFFLNTLITMNISGSASPPPPGGRFKRDLIQRKRTWLDDVKTFYHIGKTT